METIVIEGLKKYYNSGKETEVRVLNNINLSINKGDLCSIVGVSGLGKSTLLYILGCLDKQTEGKYYLDGKDISQLSEKELAILRNKYFGFVLQDFGLIEEDSAYENVYVPLLFTKKRNNIELEIEKLLKRLEILDLNKQGKTVIIVTHNLEIAKRAKRCFAIKDGIIKEYIN